VLAGRRAVVLGDEVAVVALLDAHLQVAVAARRGGAGADARVEEVLVAVVALLDAHLQVAVAARRGRAGVDARVAVIIVAVIALLAALWVHDPVAAARE
jgi:hypothetical protein